MSWLLSFLARHPYIWIAIKTLAVSSPFMAAFAAEFNYLNVGGVPLDEWLRSFDEKLPTFKPDGAVDRS